MNISKIKIIPLAIRVLIFLSKLTPLDTFTVRSIATQAFNQPSKYKHNFKKGPMNAQSARRAAEFTVEYNWVRTANQNLIVNSAIVRRDVIEEARR